MLGTLGLSTRVRTQGSWTSWDDWGTGEIPEDPKAGRGGRGRVAGVGVGPSTLWRVMLGAGSGDSHSEPSELLLPLSLLMEHGDWEGLSLEARLGLKAGSPIWRGGEVGFRQVGGGWRKGTSPGTIPGQGWGTMSSGCPAPSKGRTEGLPGV